MGCSLHAHYLTIIWAISADDKVVIFSLIFPREQEDNCVPYFRQCESSFLLGESRRPYEFDSTNEAPKKTEPGVNVDYITLN